MHDRSSSWPARATVTLAIGQSGFALIPRVRVKLTSLLWGVLISRARDLFAVIWLDASGYLGFLEDRGLPVGVEAAAQKIKSLLLHSNDYVITSVRPQNNDQIMPVRFNTCKTELFSSPHFAGICWESINFVCRPFEPTGVSNRECKLSSPRNIIAHKIKWNKRKSNPVQYAYNK